MGRIYRRKDSRNLWADYECPTTGRRRQVTLKTRDRAVAKQRLRELEMGAANRSAHAPHLLTAAVDYLVDVAAADKAPGTRRMYEERGRHLVRVLGDCDLCLLDREDVQRYIAQRQDEGASRHTVAKELTTLRQVLKEAAARRKLPGAVDGIVPKYDSKYQPRTRYLTEAEVWQLVGALPSKRKLRVLIGVYTGANSGEIDKLRWEHFDIGAGVVTIPGTKRQSRFRPVPLHPTLAMWLPAEKPRGGVVCEPWGNQVRDLAIYCDKAGIDRVTSNDIRRTFASWLKQAGVDSLTVAHLMGHTSTRMVERVYGKLSTATYRDAIDKLPKQRPALAVTKGG